MSSAVVLATAGYDRTIKYWEATTGVCSKTVKYEDSQINDLAITQDKKWLAAATHGKIQVFDTMRETVVNTLEAHSGNVMSIGFAKDSRWICSGGEDGYTRVWDLRTSRPSRSYHSKSAVNAVTIHPNQGELVSGDQSGHIRVWEFHNTNCFCELIPEPNVAVQSVTIAPDGNHMVAANSTGTCYVWKLQRGATNASHFEPLHRLAAHPDSYILKAEISPDSQMLATAATDRTVKVWNMDGSFSLYKTLGGPPDVPGGHQRWVWDCVWSVDAAYIVTASSDNNARLWDVHKGELITTYAGAAGHQKACICCALNDGAADTAAATAGTQ